MRNIRIKEFQNQIEETRFMMAAIHVEYAIVRIINLQQKKSILSKASAFQHIKNFNSQRVICLMQENAEKMVECLECVRMRLLRNSFIRVKYLNPAYGQFLKSNQQKLFQKQGQRGQNQMRFKRRQLKQQKSNSQSQKMRQESSKRELQIQVLTKAVFNLQQIYNQMMQRIAE